MGIERKPLTLNSQAKFESYIQRDRKNRSR